MRPADKLTRTRLRCAIYTRVSSDAGLEQEFNSLDNQREAAEAYIKSQAHEGWVLIPTRFDDGGFSGGSIERPALQMLLADVRSKKVDIIVVYKVDRLTRSLADFAKLVELFDANGVSFVSVTQAFNTTNSMGRLTLNVLLSFAQFEREVTGERIRDKIAASKKKGIWMGGNLPLGYRVENRKLKIVPEETEEVRSMFRRYLELRSVPALAEELKMRGFKTRVRELASGRTIGGGALTHGPLSVILKNRIYLGEITHRGKSWRGEHEPIVDVALFDAVQTVLAANIKGRKERWRRSGAILMGKIRDDRGNLMTPAHANKGPARYRYYVSCAKAQNRAEQVGSVARVPAVDVERLVLDCLRGIRQEKSIHETAIAASDEASLADDELVAAMLDQVVVFDLELRLTLKSQPDVAPASEISIPWTRPRHTRKRAVITPSGAPDFNAEPIRAEARARLIAAVIRARRWVDRLTDGSVASLAEIASLEQVSERSVRMTLPLAFLSPDIVRAAIDGALPHTAGVSSLCAAPMEWAAQMRET
ncbi:MAG: recombinase family protein [Rhodoblastus sp.]|uniref:recombinase family protein n=1 Tax=Rhodoblastus sp. TaxID=1962975 RepID=UPI003F9C103C